MSNDLISREALIGFLNSVPFMMEHQNFKDIVEEWVREQPTVYDIDKVVSQLLSECIIPAVDDSPYIMLDRAIDIVKYGGVDEKSKET